MSKKIIRRPKLLPWYALGHHPGSVFPIPSLAQNLSSTQHYAFGTLMNFALASSFIYLASFNKKQFKT